MIKDSNFKKDQYEDLGEDRFLEGKEIIARYITQEEPTYANNPLIEALPPIKSMDQVADELERLPLYSKDERNKKDILRMHAVYRLEDYIFPITKYFEIEQKISIVLRRGYVHKKIFSKEHLRALEKFSELINSPNNNVEKYKEVVISNNNLAPSASGFSIFGISGGGKSTAVSNILAYYPQHIVHTGYNNQKYLFRQLTWLKIDCTYNGNLKALCQKFFAAVDKVLDTNYSKQFGNNKSSIDKMIVAMAHVAQLHALGLFVIDEIQNLKCTKRNDESAFNFFVSMMNEVKLPILFVGTYKAIKQISNDFSQARRITGVGTIDLANLDENEEWDLFIENLWDYQWTKKECKLTSELKKIIYEKTMGIPDRVIKVYMAAQADAIRTGTEKITPEQIINIVDTYFALTEEMIDALRNHDIEALCQYEDILKPDDLKSFMVLAEDDLRRKEEAQKIMKSEQHKNKLEKKEKVDNICLFLAEAGYDYKKTIRVVEKVISEQGPNQDIVILKRKVITELLKEGKSDSKSKGDSKVKKVSKTELTKQINNSIGYPVELNIDHR